MNLRNKWTMGLLGLGVAALVGISATAVYAQTETPTATPSETPSATEQSGKGLRWGFGNIRGWGRAWGQGDSSALLAEALGITEEELQSAMTTARNALIDQAVADGQITQEQADLLKEREAGHGLGWRRMDAGDAGEAALAEALSITVEELQAAKAEVQQQLLDEAVAAGEITQEEADLIAARQAVQERLRDTVQSAYEDAVAQALADGAITQEQADLLLSEQDSLFFGPGMGGRFDGGRGGRGRGGDADGPFGFDGPRGGRDVPMTPDQTPEQTPEQSPEETPESSNSPVVPSTASNL